MSEVKPLPRYLHRNHIVEALVIAAVDYLGPDMQRPTNMVYRLSFKEEGYEPIIVPAWWVDENGPKRGSYYIVHKDGKRECLSERAFEEASSVVGS